MPYNSFITYYLYKFHKHSTLYECSPISSACSHMYSHKLSTDQDYHPTNWSLVTIPRARSGGHCIVYWRIKTEMVSNPKYCEREKTCMSMAVFKSPTLQICLLYLLKTLYSSNLNLKLTFASLYTVYASQTGQKLLLYVCAQVLYNITYIQLA